MQPGRRFLIGWATALAALGLSTAALMVAIWLVRFPIAALMLNAAFAERGADADFEITALDLSRIALRDLRFGPETAPDASIERVEVRWRWRGFSPRVDQVRLVSPRLRIRLTREGRISFGSLARMSGTPSARRVSVPALDLTIEDGQADLEAPFGNLHAVFHGAGKLGDGFSGVARIAETSQQGPTYSVEGAAAELLVVSRGNNLDFRLDADATALVWESTRTEDAHVRITGRAPLDFARYDIESAWRVGALRAPDISASNMTGAMSAEAVALPNSLGAEAWNGRMRLTAASLTLFSNEFVALRADLLAEGDQQRGQANWSLNADRFSGMSLVSEQPSASGAITVRLANGDMRGQARLALAQSRLDAQAQQRIRNAFPDLPGSPVGPTFAQAERALDAAADRFDIAVPITVTRSADVLRLFIESPAEAHAATGARLRLSRLRQDTPALVLRWPGPALHGAVSLELADGGGPDATLLLDAADWRPNAPFEADGTLTLGAWRASGASISAHELGVSIAVAPGGAGRVDLRGRVHVTGPIGDGEVRDLTPDLDVAVLWKPGWRVVPNHGCIPTQLAGLDAAGLSFGAGTFSLCPLNGTLIASDANDNLSGGFVVRELALNGHMAGPAAQPARITAASLTGMFGGRVGDVILALEADTPRVAIAMDADRTLNVALQRLTASAHIADSWRIAGAFEAGTLSDPALPGSVSTIEGTWNAAPENGAPVIRVASADALVTANRPSSEDERPLFQPLRLANVSAILQRGRLDANGNIVLAAQQRQLAEFTAWHQMQDGVGAAQVTAPSIVFSETLQPYQITERARGVIANVRGPAAAIADVAWSRENIAARGSVRLDGVSFATTTLPIVEDVRGVVVFDDLFALTTPPSQDVSVGLLNPGIAVRNGRVRFQLLPEQRINIEDAAFQFAGGVLAMQPTSVTLGEDETQIVLTLNDVDAGGLIAALSIPDMEATGRLEGAFPLRLTARTAYVENGVLHALPGGGTLSYTGNAGQNALGVTRIAFDALRSFHYDELALRLNGDISGDVLTEIEFSGQNTGGAVDLGPIAPVPGLGNVTVRGVPFDFNVRINAPFRSLARTAASIADPGALLNESRRGQDAQIDVQTRPRSPVDGQTPVPR